jgi:tRNA U34 5-carboxymethylaminomethyl modifying GTPase MnmE/TrmE
MLDEELKHLILAEPWVVLYGRSGVGKSSLLNAGVVADFGWVGFAAGLSWACWGAAF